MLSSSFVVDVNGFTKRCYPYLVSLSSLLVNFLIRLFLFMGNESFFLFFIC